MSPFDTAFLFLKRQMGLYNYDDKFPHPDDLGDVDLYHATSPKNKKNIMREGIKAHPNTDNTAGAWMDEKDFEGMSEEEVESYFKFKQPLAWTADNRDVATDNYGSQLVGVRSKGLEPEIEQDEQPDDSSYAAFGHDIDPSRLVFY